MKVILKRDVPGLGKAGAVADVADGYGRNFLLPRGLAAEATSGNLTQLAGQKAAKHRRDEKALAEAQALSERITGRPLIVEAKAGERGKLFGAVTNAQIAEALRRQFGTEIDRHRIELREPIKAAGDHPCAVRLTQGVTAHITVRVQAASGVPSPGR